MVARLLKEGVRHSYQQTRLRREFVDEGRVVAVLHGEVGSEVASHGYGPHEVPEPPHSLAGLGRGRAEDEDGFAEQEAFPDRPEVSHASFKEE